MKNLEYLDGFQYTGEELNFFPHAEGYVNVVLGTTGNRIFNYVYNYTDHLGNIRLSYTKDLVNNQLKIMEENHYYPFGLKHQKYTAGVSIGIKAIDENTARPASMTSTPYNYKYNGQEFQDELGLNMYDMDMRQYDPAIARWVILDPVIHHSMSPYNAFDNNPVFWADPSGADSVFDNLGDSVSSISNMWGETIAGVSGDTDDNSQRRSEGQASNPSKDPGKKSWLGRTISKIGKGIGKLFGGGKAAGGVDQSSQLDLMGFFEDSPMFGETETATTSYSIEENPYIDLNFRNSDKVSGTKGKINTDTETIIDVNNPQNSLIRKNYQLINPAFKASAFGGLNKPIVGVSLEQSFMGLGGVSGVLTADLSKPQHSSMSIRISENINLNSNSKSIGIGIKPIGALILILSRGAVGAGALSPALR